MIVDVPDDMKPKTFSEALGDLLGDYADLDIEHLIADMEMHMYYGANPEDLIEIGWIHIVNDGKVDPTMGGALKRALATLEERNNR
jgi:hypothetical protein